MAINWGGAGTGFVGGALSGAALTGFNPLGIAAGAGIGAFMGNQAGAKKKAPGYTPIPYSGRSPESPSYTKESEKAYYDTILPRSQGVGVGYSPEWLTSSNALIQSNLGQARDDRLRENAGSLSAAGLSGNLRAGEATKGRTLRDYGQSLEDATSKLTIADMERKNQERDTNTARLGQFNQFEFGQGNAAANFDLSKWSDENQFARSAAGLDAGNYWEGVNNQNEMTSDLGQSALALMMPQAAPSVLNQTATPGQGISASGLSGNPSTSLSYEQWKAAKDRGLSLQK